jgi:hypothetical protein
MGGEPADRLLAGVVGRMRLAREHHLERQPRMDRAQPVEVGEQQVGALVGGHPAREADHR